MNYKLTTQPRHEVHTGNSIEELLMHLKLVESLPFFQVVVDEDDGRNICLFCNGYSALALWHDGTSGGSYICNSQYEGQNSLQRFYLDNGESDEFSKTDYIPKQEGISALLSFCRNGERPIGLNWLDI